MSVDVSRDMHVIRTSAAGHEQAFVKRYFGVRFLKFPLEVTEKRMLRSDYRRMANQLFEDIQEIVEVRFGHGPKFIEQGQ